LLNDRAARVEEAFGIKMDTLLRIQTAYEIAPEAPKPRELNQIASLRVGGVGSRLARNEYLAP
jgi:plasmid maintenance system antidote protein VapI